MARHVWRYRPDKQRAWAWKGGGGTEFDSDTVVHPRRRGSSMIRGCVTCRLCARRRALFCICMSSECTQLGDSFVTVYGSQVGNNRLHQTLTTLHSVDSLSLLHPRSIFLLELPFCSNGISHVLSSNSRVAVTHQISDSRQPTRDATPPPGMPASPKNPDTRHRQDSPGGCPDVVLRAVNVKCVNIEL